MKKILSLVCVGALTIGLFTGCSNKNSSEQTTKIVENKEVEESKNKNKDNKDNNDIFLTTHNNNLVKRAWTNAKEYFILSNCDNEKICVFKNNEMLYSIDDEYLHVFLSPSGDKFVCQKIDRDNKQWQLDMYNTEDGTKQGTYFQQKDEFFVLTQWTEKGMFFEKFEGWTEGNMKLIPKLFILDQQKEFQEIWDYSNTNYEVCDINGDWALLKNYDKKKFEKINLNTKEIEDTNFSYDSIETLYNVYFHSSPNVLVGQILYNNAYATFLFENGQMEIITENAFIGTANNGVVYKKFKRNGNGEIYLKLLK